MQSRAASGPNDAVGGLSWRTVVGCLRVARRSSLAVTASRDPALAAGRAVSAPGACRVRDPRDVHRDIGQIFATIC